MVRRRFISTRALKQDMVIDQAIIDRSGRVLIARKTVLDDFLIEALQKMNVTRAFRAGSGGRRAFVYDIGKRTDTSDAGGCRAE